MKNLLFAMLLLIGNVSFAQETKLIEKPSFVMTLNLGGNIFTYQDDGYEVMERYTLNARNWEVGFRINPIHEFGFIIGSSDFPNNHYAIGGGTIQNGVLIDTIYRKVSTPYDRSWLGVYYIYHFKNIIHGGLRFAHLLGGRTYHEFFMGKEISILKNFFARINISISNTTKNLFGFSERNILFQYGGNFGFGVLF